ncbi:MAG: flavodoxin-dependent (E)-4-hydroxy-3-methylbut-2-enyl-diphosphate synthase, partial [Isosphaeraceae bacterium]
HKRLGRRSMAYSTTVPRHKTREVGIGEHVLGGTNPISVQSMTTTNTFDVQETLAQIRRLEEAGCEIVRVTVPKKEDVEGVKAIRDQIRIPLIADIHYDYRMALACLEARTPSGRRAVDKIRINPGNIGGEERFKEVVRQARDAGVPMRIGVNSGSLEKDLIDKYGFPCPEAMVESALRHIETAEALGYKLMIVSLKASHVPTAVECYTQYAAKCDYPTHVGITEAGSREYGTLKSAAGIGAILLRGIGDTIRVSLLGDPVPEIDAGFDILRACDRRVTKPEVVACPTCGRLDIDLERIVAEVEDRMKGLSNPLRISILGCLVNGFGEAKEADLGIAAGSGKGIIFKRGVPIRHVKEDEMVAALLEEVARFDEETKPLASFVEKQKQQKTVLTVLG